MKRFLAAAAIILTACALTYGTGSAEAAPNQPAPDMPLSIVGPTSCPNDGIVIAQGRAPRTGQYTLETWDETSGIWVPIQIQIRQVDDIVRLQPNARMWDGETRAFRLSSPPPREARDDSTTLTIWVMPTVITAPICD